MGTHYENVEEYLEHVGCYGPSAEFPEFRSADQMLIVAVLALCDEVEKLRTSVEMLTPE